MIAFAVEDQVVLTGFMAHADTAERGILILDFRGRTPRNSKPWAGDVGRVGFRIRVFVGVR
jgi:hypothetical protein